MTEGGTRSYPLEPPLAPFTTTNDRYEQRKKVRKMKKRKVSEIVKQKDGLEE